MHCAKVNLIIFLCTISIKYGVSDETNELESFMKNVKIDQVKIGAHESPYVGKLVFKGKSQESMFVYINDPFACNLCNICKLNTFYIYSNCLMGNWIKNRLYEIIKTLPLLYHSEFYGSEYGNIYGNYVDQLYKALSKTNENLNRYLTIIYSMRSIASNLKTSDMTVGKLIFELKLMIEYIMSLYDVSNPAKNKVISDTVIIRLFLKTINTVQGFMVTNCYSNTNTSIMARNNENKKFYGYGIDTSSLNTNHIQNLLNDISPLNLESYSVLCDSDNMLLIKNVLLSSDKFADITKAKIELNNVKIDMTNAIKQVKSSMFDSKVVFWFLRSILDTVMKIIYSKTIKIISSNISEKQKAEFVAIHDNLKTYSFPGEMVEYFADINSSQFQSLQPSIVVAEITDRMNALKNVELDSDSTVSLKQFMDEIMSAQNDFTCFNYLFTVLSTEYGKYNISVKIEKTEIEDKGPGETVSVENNSSECEFIQNLYLITLEMHIIINKGSSKANNNESLSFFDDLCKKFDIFTKHLYMAIEIKTWQSNKDIFAFINHLFVIALNIKCVSKRDFELKEYQGLVNLIMVELNDYGIKRCSTPPVYNFLLFDNINYNEIGNLSLINERIKNALQIPASDKTVINLKKYNYFDLKTVKDDFVKTFVFNTYKSVLLFQWKNQQISIEDIYQQSINLLVISPCSIYEIYDLEYKFILSAFYFELKKVFSFLKGNNYAIAKKEAYKNSIQKGLVKLMTTKLPGVLGALQSDINDFGNALSSSINAKSDKPLIDTELGLNNSKFERISLNIDYKFETLRTIINYNSEVGSDGVNALVKIPNHMREVK